MHQRNLLAGVRRVILVRQLQMRRRRKSKIEQACWVLKYDVYSPLHAIESLPILPWNLKSRKRFVKHPSEEQAINSVNAQRLHGYDGEVTMSKSSLAFCSQAIQGCVQTPKGPRQSFNTRGQQIHGARLTTSRISQHQNPI